VISLLHEISLSSIYSSTEKLPSWSDYWIWCTVLNSSWWYSCVIWDFADLNSTFIQGHLFIEALYAFMISVFAFYSLTLFFYDINVFILLIMLIFELYSLQFLIAVFAFMMTLFAFYLWCQLWAFYSLKFLFIDIYDINICMLISMFTFIHDVNNFIWVAFIESYNSIVCNYYK